ncbi:MAG: hydrolase 1, exosortase A system-associated [Burkholderiales bacterium]|nr:hydrolase 1, exosortase A system-associated [Burkholderiales bacterium]
MSVAAVDGFVAFDCGDATCLGVLSRCVQAESRNAVGVVVVVGGPQYRVGSHRQFTLLARALAGAGVPTLRFDYRGMGDSDGEPRTFETIDDDIRAAIDALQRETGVARAVLWGLCDGATAAMFYAASDPRVAGIVALNPWARSTHGEAVVRLRHYYLQRLFTGAFWRKLVTGKFAARAAAGGLAANVRNAVGARDEGPSGFLPRMEAAWRGFRRPMLVFLSGNDFTAREFEDWVAGGRRRRALLADPLTEVARFADADHTFSDRASRDAVAAKTIEWIRRYFDLR